MTVPTPRRTAAVLLAVAAAALLLAGCVAKSDVAASDALTVTSTDGACDVSAGTATSGTLAFDVANESSQTTEFYLLASDGLRIVGEVENIAPGASRTLTVTAQPGDYVTLCKPGMVGDGIGRAAFTVTGESVAVQGDDAQQMQQAVDLYAAFVKDQVGRLLPATKEFVAAYEAGDDATARTLYPTVRAYYERIEPVAEALGDLDPRIDSREVDAVAGGTPWVGFHPIEKDLWVPASDALNADGVTPAWKDWAPSDAAGRAAHGAELLAAIQELYDYVHSTDFDDALDAQGIAGISNGAIGLLDEVATGKITGEENWWSGTDVYDFVANVEGSKMAFTLVRDLAASTGDGGTALVARIDKGYADLEAELAENGSAQAGYTNFRDLGDAEKRTLTDLLNALAEPLSQLTGTVLQ